MVISRRSLFVATAVTGLGAAFRLNQTEAARGWCLADPIVLIDGQLSDIFVQSDLAMLTTATGPLKMLITLPTNSTGSVVLTDVGYLRGYDITFKHSASLKKTKRHTQVQVSVYAPSSRDLPVTVNFAPRNLSRGVIALLVAEYESGSSNSWVRLTTS